MAHPWGQSITTRLCGCLRQQVSRVHPYPSFCLTLHSSFFSFHYLNWKKKWAERKWKWEWKESAEQRHRRVREAAGGISLNKGASIWYVVSGIKMSWVNPGRITYIVPNSLKIPCGIFMIQVVSSPKLQCVQVLVVFFSSKQIISYCSFLALLKFLGRD